MCQQHIDEFFLNGSDFVKIEKINDKQIRCTLNSADLSSRQLKISELAYGSEKARGLFKEMMEKANDEFGFEAEDTPLMIEAIPMSPDCIVLLITKVDDPEELDTRFSKFAPSSRKDDSEDDTMDGEYETMDADTEEPDPADSVLDFYENEPINEEETQKEEEKTPSQKLGEAIGGGLSGFLKALKDEIANSFGELAESISEGTDNEGDSSEALETESDIKDADSIKESQPQAEEIPAPDLGNIGVTPEPSAEEAAERPEPISRLFSFTDWDLAQRACEDIGNIKSDTLESLLYKDRDKGIYYLLITGHENDKSYFFKISNLLTEYIHKEKVNYATISRLSEHCSVIIKADALEILKKY